MYTFMLLNNILNNQILLGIKKMLYLASIIRITFSSFMLLVYYVYNLTVTVSAFFQVRIYYEYWKLV